MKIMQPPGVDFGVTTPTSGIRVGVLKFWNRHNPNVNAADALGAVEHVEYDVDDDHDLERQRPQTPCS